jgi:lipooligosaccharide transport system permease protein
MSHPTAAVLEYHFVMYRRVWRGSVFTSFLVPVLFLLGMGVSVGGYVGDRGPLGVPYLDFIAPGLLVSTALQVAVSESMWPVFDGFTWNRRYEVMRTAPLRVRDILLGHVAFVQLRALVAVAGFLVVVALFGAAHSPRAPLTLLVGLLVGCATACPIFAYSAWVKSEAMFAVVMRFGVIPMTLFAGVFFPVDSLPPAARALAYVSPLWHGVEMSRAATLGVDTAWGWPLHTAYLLAWVAVGWPLALRQFTRRLDT